MKFKIWCEVHGGIAGTRTRVKNKDGKDLVFDTLTEARAACPLSKVDEGGGQVRYGVHELEVT